MAFIRKTDAGTYAVIYKDNLKRRQKNFKTRTEAKKFMTLIESTPEQIESRVLFSELLKTYRDTESQKKKGYRNEVLRIEALLRRPLAKKYACTITARDLEQHAEMRRSDPGRTVGTTLSESSLRKEFTLMSAVFTWAIKKGYLTKNPVKDFDKPREPEHRERVATDAEKQKLMDACGWDGVSMPQTKEQLTIAAFLFACATGMRAGEILKMEESWIEGRVVHLPASAIKTETRRDVALSKEALRILDLVRERGCAPCPFGDVDDASRDALYRKIRDRAGLGAVYDSKGRLIKEGLNFHDSRATFCTWAASPDPKTGAPRLDVLALARQTGHRNLAMLQRYYRASAEAIALMLDSAL